MSNMEREPGTPEMNPFESHESSVRKVQALSHHNLRVTTDVLQDQLGELMGSMLDPKSRIDHSKLWENILQTRILFEIADELADSTKNALQEAEQLKVDYPLTSTDETQ